MSSPTLTLLTDEQWHRLVAYTQANPKTTLRIVTAYSDYKEAMWVLWTGPSRWLNWLALL